jgi:hypothetical protein
MSTAISSSEVSAGQYQAAAVSVTSGNNTPLQTDSLGNLFINSYVAQAGEDLSNNVTGVALKLLPVTTYSPSVFQNLGANATLSIKATTGNVFGIYCVNANAATRYIGIYNSASTASGTPLLSFAVPGNGGSIMIGTDFFTTSGLNCSTGIAFGFSTSPSTYSAGSASDMTICQITFV